MNETRLIISRMNDPEKFPASQAEADAFAARVDDAKKEMKAWEGDNTQQQVYTEAARQLEAEREAPHQTIM